MAFNLTGLEKYVDEQRLPLIKKSVLGGKTIGMINLQTGVKGSAAINLLNVDPAIQAGGCGFTAQGDTTLSQRVINSKILKVNLEWCDKDLASTWASHTIKIGAGKEVMPFGEYFTTAIVEGVNEKMEKMVWQGDAENDNECDGILKVLADAEGVLSANGTGAYAAIKATYSKIPVAVLPKATIFVGADTFRSFMLEMVEKNYYHYPANGSEVQEFVLPGTNTKVVAVNGLNGTNKVVAAAADNLFYGCDMLDDAESFDLFYSKDNRTWRCVIVWNAGTQVAYPNEVVVGTIA